MLKYLEITEASWYRWPKQDGGMKSDDAERLKELERQKRLAEGARCRQALDIDLQRELNWGSW